MNKEQIQDRINQINKEMIQTKANYAKLEGHLGEAQHWLIQAVKKEESNGEVNIEGTSEVAEQGLCDAIGEEVSCSGQEPRSECESESAAAV